MEKVLLSILVASELCALFSSATHQFQFVCDMKTMAEARSYCRDKHVDLATVHNMEDVKTLNKMAKDAGCGKRAWIGLHVEKDDWSWSLADKGFYRDEEAEFRKWQGARSGERCVIMNANGLWQDKGCENHFKAICLNITGQNEEYTLVNISMTWTEAQSYCRKNHTDLASVRNNTENQKIQQKVLNGEAWIGLFGGSWKWSDGSNSSFRNWNVKSNQPNSEMDEGCVRATFTSDGRWGDWPCHTKSAFICSKHEYKKQVVRIKVVKRDSSLDLNDPVVLENILKQIKQKLKDQGVSEDVHLSWRNQPNVFCKAEEKEKEKEKDEAGCD